MRNAWLLANKTLQICEGIPCPHWPDVTLPIYSILIFTNQAGLINYLSDKKSKSTTNKCFNEGAGRGPYVGKGKNSIAYHVQLLRNTKIINHSFTATPLQKSKTTLRQWSSEGKWKDKEKGVRSGRGGCQADNADNVSSGLVHTRTLSARMCNVLQICVYRSLLCMLQI